MRGCESRSNPEIGLRAPTTEAIGRTKRIASAIAAAMRFALSVLTAALLASAPAWAQEITGPARVIDGDTLDISGQRIRLHGIDAPESKQRCRAGRSEIECGREATKALRRIIARESVTCEERDVDRYGRIVAVCLNSDGEDINAAMVAQGWALAYRQFSDDYVDQEGEAREAGLGMWRGRFVAPWDWRRGDRLMAAQPARPANDNAASQCLIKGNISSKGEKIYHVPGGAYYGRTKISRAKGERFFCSEAEARVAGWRASRR